MNVTIVISASLVVYGTTMFFFLCQRNRSELREAVRRWDGTAEDRSHVAGVSWVNHQGFAAHITFLCDVFGYLMSSFNFAFLNTNLGQSRLTYLTG